MFEFGTVVIAIAVFVIFFTFFGPQWWFKRVFPDSMEAISVVQTMWVDYKMNVFPQFYDDKTKKLLTTWEFLSISDPSELGDHELDITEKGKEFADKYQNSKYGIRLFVIGKLGQKLLKFTLPFIGANILFVWYKFFENYLEKLFDMCL